MIALVSAGFMGLIYWNNHIVHTPVVNDESPTILTQESVLDIPAGWKTYEDTEWGFQISYPPRYRFLSAKDNLNGPSHYLLPQQPYAKSGYVGKLLEMSASGTSTVRELLQIVLLPMQPKSLDVLDTQVQVLAASSTAMYKNKGMLFTFKHISIDGRNLPAISNTFPDGKYTQIQIYYFQPPTTIFGKPQPSKLFRVDYQPEDNAVLQQVVSTMKTISVVPPDSSLYYSAESNKDPFWCDKISNSEIKTACYINLRGHPIIDRFPVDLKAVIGKTGAVQVGNSAITLTMSKIDDKSAGAAWVAFSVTAGAEPWQGVTFNSKMTNGEKAQALLTVYWDSEVIGQVDGRVFLYPDNTFIFGTSTRPNSLHTLGFRLDSFAPGTTSVTISNIAGENVH